MYLYLMSSLDACELYLLYVWQQSVMCMMVTWGCEATYHNGNGSELYLSYFSQQIKSIVF